MQAVAERIGYGSASAFSTAFARNTGTPPSRYAGATERRLLPAGEGPSRLASGGRA